MRGRRLSALLAALAAAVVTASACGGGTQSAGEGAGQETVWKYGVYEPGADAGFLLMAKEKGFFAKHGVKVEYVEFKSSQQAFPALLSGEVDAIQGNPSEALLAADKGAKLKFIGSTMPGLPYVMYAKSKFGSLEELSGASVAISTPTALPAIVAKQMLTQAGVDLDSVKFVNAGGSPDRYKAVVSGRVDAASDPSDFMAQAEKDNVKVLARAKDVIPDYPRYAIIARADALQEKPKAAVGLLAGLMEGIRYALNHEDEANALTAKTLGVSPDAPQVTELYTEFKDGGYLAADAMIPVKQIQYLSRLQTQLGVTKEPIDVKPLVDDTYRQKALKTVGKVPPTYYGTTSNGD